MATGRFDNVKLGGLAEIQPWTQPGPRIYLGGERGGLAEFLRLGGFKALAAGPVSERYALMGGGGWAGGDSGPSSVPSH